VSEDLYWKDIKSVAGDSTKWKSLVAQCSKGRGETKSQVYIIHLCTNATALVVDLAIMLLLLLL